MAPAGNRKRLGAVERLGKSSGPDPTVSLTSKNLNQARAGNRRGNFYEKASSRHARTKEALERHGEISRDGAVALGGRQHLRGTKRRAVFDEGISSLDDQMMERAKERAIRIRHANNNTHQLQRAASGGGAAAGMPKRAKKTLLTVASRRTSSKENHHDTAAASKSINSKPQATRRSSKPTVDSSSSRAAIQKSASRKTKQAKRQSTTNQGQGSCAADAIVID